jgi:hypothetical protein
MEYFNVVEQVIYYLTMGLFVYAIYLIFESIYKSHMKERGVKLMIQERDRQRQLERDRLRNNRVNKFK